MKPPVWTYSESWKVASTLAHWRHRRNNAGIPVARKSGKEIRRWTWEWAISMQIFVFHINFCPRAPSAEEIKKQPGR